jgi:hypothetical protein
MMLLHLPLQTLHVLLLEDRQLYVTGAAHAVARRILDAFPNHLLLHALKNAHAVAEERCMMMLTTNCCWKLHMLLLKGYMMLLLNNCCCRRCHMLLVGRNA